MRTCVTPSTDCSHREWASLLSWSLSAPLPVLPLLCCWKGALNPLLPAHFLPQRIGTRLLAVKMEQEFHLGPGVSTSIWGNTVDSTDIVTP